MKSRETFEDSNESCGSIGDPYRICGGVFAAAQTADPSAFNSTWRTSRSIVNGMLQFHLVRNPLVRSYLRKVPVLLRLCVKTDRLITACRLTISVMRGLSSIGFGGTSIS